MSFLFAVALATVPATGGEVDSFRDSILRYYGFTDKAAKAIRSEIVHLEIEDWDATSGGVEWDAARKTLLLRTTQQRAAVWGLARVWWDVWLRTHPLADVALVEDVARTPVAEATRGLEGGELFAELAAYTMGRFKSGTRALPRGLWKYYQPMFTGHIYRTPYYDGGIP